jgi:phycocyanobilin lyase alpha subunit
MASNQEQDFLFDTSAGNPADGASLTIEQAIANLQQTEDTGLRYYAAWWLGRFRIKEKAVLELLIRALEDDVDRSTDGGYPLRRNAAKALGKVGDRTCIPPLVKCLECSDYYVRESAAQALEMIGEKDCIPALVQLLDGGVESAQQVPGKPHLVQPYAAILEALGTLGATDALGRIEEFLQHPVAKVHYAAARAMYQLTGDGVYGERLVQALQGKELQLRRTALFDLGASGYIEGADAIASTLAENSLKLIALKNLLEGHLAQQEKDSTLSGASIKIMVLMDQLL